MTDRQTEIKDSLRTLAVRLEELNAPVPVQCLSSLGGTLRGGLLHLPASTSSHQKLGLEAAKDAVAAMLLNIPGLEHQEWSFRVRCDDGTAHFWLTLCRRTVISDLFRELDEATFCLRVLQTQLAAADAHAVPSAPWGKYEVSASQMAQVALRATSPRHAAWIYAAIAVIHYREFATLDQVLPRISAVTQIHSAEAWK